LVVAWRMLLTGEVYRATKPALLEQKRQQLGRRLEAASNWQAVLWELWPSHGARRRRRRCAA
ncbi:MAG: IS110 family transposase, partial [Armatimonadota bacterium]|nr:IS110 family transposase [Armatimonadota bacterium]